MSYLQVERINIFWKKRVGRTYLFKWVPVEELEAYNLQPAFIKEKVKDIAVHTEHIVLQD